MIRHGEWEELLIRKSSYKNPSRLLKNSSKFWNVYQIHKCSGCASPTASDQPIPLFRRSQWYMLDQTGQLLWKGTLAGTCAFGSYLFLRTNGSELRVRLYPDNVEYMNNIKVKPKQSVIDCVWMKLGNIPPLHQWGISVPRRGILATFLSLNPVQTNSAQYIQSVKCIREHTLVRKANVCEIPWFTGWPSSLTKTSCWHWFEVVF